jgi:hypothetical protein
MEIFFLFKAKTQPANNSSGHEGDERHNTKVDGQMYSENVKITDLIRKHLKTKEERERKRRSDLFSGSLGF